MCNEKFKSIIESCNIKFMSSDYIIKHSEDASLVVYRNIQLGELLIDALKVKKHKVIFNIKTKEFVDIKIKLDNYKMATIKSFVSACKNDSKYHTIIIDDIPVELCGERFNSYIKIIRLGGYIIMALEDDTFISYGGTISEVLDTLEGISDTINIARKEQN